MLGWLEVPLEVEVSHYLNTCIIKTIDSICRWEIGPNGDRLDYLWGLGNIIKYVPSHFDANSVSVIGVWL